MPFSGEKVFRGIFWFFLIFNFIFVSPGFSGPAQGSNLESSVKNTCDDYQISEERFFRSRWAQWKSITNTYFMSYSVQRLDVNNYLVKINPTFSFQKRGDLNQPGSEAQRITQLRQKIKKCLQQFNRQISLSSEGRLQLELSEPQDVTFPKAIPIRVVEGNFRPRPRQFSTNMSCEAYIHELLHLAGLQDENTEKSLEKKFFGYGETHDSEGLTSKAAFDCRSTSDSLMGEPGRYNFKFSYQSQPALRPAHLRQILYPNCQSRNPVYLSCQKNLYRTSEAHGGEGCAPVHPLCSEPNAWLN